MKFRHFFLIFAVFAVLTGCQPKALVRVDNVNQAKPINQNQSEKPAVIENTTTPNAVKTPVVETSTPTVTKPKTTDNPEVVIPKFLDYPVAFATQAPYTNWDALHEEACEEAAMTMAEKYFKKESLSAHVMEQSILNLVKWEEAHGYKVDLTADEATEILKTYFGLKAVVVDDVSVNRIKQELIAKKLIIIPAAGRQLGNPNFKQPGPIYHMLILRGYDDNKGEFITNDPGTRKGEGYRYRYQVLIDAIHDWPAALALDGMADEEIETGRKVMIVVNL
ncbi:MAG: C39 family peptidase [Candidatus Buchananbacteria bacterium]